VSAPDELMLDSMGPSSKGGFEIRTHAGGPETAETLLFIADSMRATLDAHDAPNYLEMEVKASDGKRYIMTLQRAGKITPHAARLAAEEAREAAKPRVIETVEELEALPNGSVVLSEVYRHYVNGMDISFQRWEDGLWHRGARSTDTHPDNFLPVKVIHEPAVTS
jgi:hypothetical protein